MKGGGGGFLRNFSRHHDSSLFCSRDKEPFFVKDVDVVVVVVVVVRTLRRRRYLTPAPFSSGLLKKEEFPLFLFPQLPFPLPWLKSGQEDTNGEEERTNKKPASFVRLKMLRQLSVAFAADAANLTWNENNKNGRTNRSVGKKPPPRLQQPRHRRRRRQRTLQIFVVIRHRKKNCCCSS